MTTAVAEHWASGDVYGRIVTALHAAGKSLDALTIEDLAPVDHFHARGLPATIELGDSLPARAGDHLLDVGCGLGGPARYFARRFGCRVSGIDVTGPFIDAGRRLTELLGMGAVVDLRQGDGQALPYGDGTFDGGYAQHVTMNVPDRPSFFGEAWRVIRPGGFFAITEHGRGNAGPTYHPVPWSEDGRGEFLVTPEETVELLGAAGFVDIDVTDTGQDYLQGYRATLAVAERGELPALGLHVLMGPGAVEKWRNSARNNEEGRTHPVTVICRKSG
jgi:SAM-dependent methyltransferase